MRRFSFVTVDVFTERRFGGNPLAVFPDAQGLTDAEMQSLAAEFNLSETTFVLPPENPGNTARVRIFNRVAEMPFAGHPNVGTGWVLARLGRAPHGRLKFEEIAGLVDIEVVGETVTIEAPQKLTLGPEMPADLLATCIGVTGSDVAVSAHRPVVASVGNGFIVAEVRAEALAEATPDVGRFRVAWPSFPHLGANRLPIYVYTRDGERALRARMFSPLSGTPEDAATGSAAAPLAALLLSLTTQAEQRYEITQGVEMGRPSRLLCTARRGKDGSIRAKVGGSCVPVMEGTISL